MPVILHNPAGCRWCGGVSHGRDRIRVYWDHELVTHRQEIVDGYLILPDRPGWGTEPNEEALRAHPPKGPTGLLSYGRKA